MERIISKDAAQSAMRTMYGKRRGINNDWGAMEYDTAIKALDRHVPKGPVLKLDQDNTEAVMYYICPRCSCNLETYGFERSTTEHLVYCPECGQRIER